MEGQPQEVREYVTGERKNPFLEWLRSLKDVQARGRIRVRINRLRLGNFGDCKSVGEGVLELRIPTGPGYRVYFGRAGQTIILLLCGGDKSTQEKDIKKAKGYWNDYRRRVL